MAERGAAALENRRAAAIAAVGRHVAATARGARPLAPAELRRRTGLDAAAGWRVQVEAGDAVLELDLLLDARFPYAPPRIALGDADALRGSPHVEEDGLLCLLPSGTAVDPDRPVEVARAVLAAAAELLLRRGRPGAEDDFRAEFVSYWRVPAGRPVVRGLVRPEGPSRRIALWRGENWYLVAETREDLLRWLAHLTGKDSVRAVEEAVLLWLERAPLPSEFPRTASDALRLAEDCGTQDLLAGVPGGKGVIVVLGASTANGPGLVSFEVPRPRPEPRPPGVKAPDPVARGFRGPSAVPERFARARAFGGALLSRRRYDRVDAAWVHGRGTDDRQPKLAASIAVLIGCGSLGSGVAELLARAGVGRLALVDPEPLAAANLGRHALGAADLGRHKAAALAERLRAAYPHFSGVEARTVDWESAQREDAGLLPDADVVVSTTGDWGAEAALNAWHVANGRQPSVVYGWTEAFAVAGHAVTVAPGGGCLACGLSPTGAPALAVARWPGGEALRREPACGTTYQPYGPVELAHTISLIAEAVMGALVSPPAASSRTVWCGRRDRLAGAGGEWTDGWARLAGARAEGGFVERLPWLQDSLCPACGP